MAMANAHVHVCEDNLGTALAQYIHEQQTAALERHGRFVVALSGGSMPKVLGAALTGESAPSFNWASWHIFFADERCVPTDHDDSNFKACEQALFGKVPIPAANLHPLQHDPADVGNPQPAAARYEAELRAVFPDVGADALPELDLILLGMGPDGHTASLFPSHPLLSFDSAWVAAIADSPKPPPSRVTLTLPVINAARGVAFVTTGASKADALGAIFGNGDQPCQLPSALVRCQGGAAPVHWFVDAAAASSVPSSAFTPEAPRAADPAPSARHFLFGYGSLICADSRARSGQTGLCIPVIAQGLKRTWSASIDISDCQHQITGVTAVAVEQTDDLAVACNGVIVEVAEADIPKFDEREKGYSRVRLPTARLAVVREAAGGATVPEDACVWVYVSGGGAASEQFPVIQSYVDVIMLGCEQISPAFMEQFVETTTGWAGNETSAREPEGVGGSAAWIDDRAHPAYVRADSNATARAAVYDEVLSRIVPKEFSRRALNVE
eukprot:g2433.t1